MLISCNSEQAKPEAAQPQTTVTKGTAAESNQNLEEYPPAGTTSLGTIDMGEYTISVTAITPYHPDEMQSKMMKWDDAKKDYFTISCSVTNKTNKPVDSGKDMLGVYFTFNDGTTSSNVLRGASILASAQVGRKLKHPKKNYDLIWGKNLPPKETLQAELFGVEAPEGATVSGFGFFKK